MIDKMDLPPRAVVLDLVLKYTPKMPSTPGTMSILHGNMILATRNHLGQVVSYALPIHLDGEPEDGASPRFVLRKLGPTVWKVSPSLLHDLLHAYITLVEVPDPAPWEAK